jgi:phosphoribosylformylglycinamidine synthase subunit PurS
MIKASVTVMLKKAIFDPQGMAVKHGLDSIGFKNIDDVRVGRQIIIQIDSNDFGHAEEEVKEMCDKLLANPVVESWSHTLELMQ